MTGSIAPNRPGHHGTVVARTVGTVAISCNVRFSLTKTDSYVPYVILPIKTGSFADPVYTACDSLLAL